VTWTILWSFTYYADHNLINLIQSKFVKTKLIVVKKAVKAAQIVARTNLSSSKFFKLFTHTQEEKLV